MNDNPEFKKGDEVLSRYDPGRRGYLTGKSRDIADLVYHQVKFSDGTEYISEPELLLFEARHGDWDSMIEDRIFGSESDLRRTLSHIQLNGKLSSLIYSLDVTNTEFFPHQFKPVLAFFESPSHGLLIADEVGLGKTIEAGLIWTELRAREDCRRILVVCPAMLREKWRDELRNRFGVDATIMDAKELLHELKRPPEQSFDGKGIICSIQGIRPPSNSQQEQNSTNPRNQLGEFLEAQDGSSLIDLAVIDEAHYLRNRETQSANLGRLLRGVSKNMLLLSATPINLRSEDLYSLLNIVDAADFNLPGSFPAVLDANEPLIKARQLVLDPNESAENILHFLNAAAKHYLLNGSKQLKGLIDTLADPASIATDSDRVRLADRIDRVNLLRHVVTRTRKSEVMEFNAQRRPGEEFVDLNEHERHFYDLVTAAIRQYAEEQGISDGFLLATPQRQVSSCMYAAAKAWGDRTYRNGQYGMEDMIYEDMGIEAGPMKSASPFMDYLTSIVLPAVNLQQLREHDSKFNAFHKFIEKYLSEYPKEKIVVFSYFRATLHYLKTRLAESGVTGEVIMGGMQESKQEVINRFRDDPSIQILLSSEVASEGVDLQFSRAIINYDLPWNPMKIEQRIGRLDRIGQKSKSIVIWNLGCADTIDQRIYERLFVRLDIFKRALGGMEAILGEEIRKLTDDIMQRELSAQEEETRITTTANSIANNRLLEEELEKNAANLIAHSDYILEQVKTAHKTNKRITEQDLIIYVRDFLNKQSGHEFRQTDSEKNYFEIKLPPDTAVELERYVQTKKLKYTRLARGERVRCEFVNKTDSASGNIEKINQFHPLVRFINSKINTEDFAPVVAVKLIHQKNDTELNLPGGQYAFAVQKWGFTGLREEEDIRAKMIHIESDFRVAPENSWNLLNAVRLRGTSYPEAASDAPAHLTDKILECYAELDKEFLYLSEVKKTENEDRANVQKRSAYHHRDNQIKTRKRVLEEYRQSGRTRLIPAMEKRVKNLETILLMTTARLDKQAKMEVRKSQTICGVLFLESNETVQ